MKDIAVPPLCLVGLDRPARLHCRPCGRKTTLRDNLFVLFCERLNRVWIVQPVLNSRGEVNLDCAEMDFSTEIRGTWEVICAVARRDPAFKVHTEKPPNVDWPWPDYVVAENGTVIRSFTISVWRPNCGKQSVKMDLHG